MKIVLEEGAVCIELSRWDRVRAVRLSDLRLDLDLIKGVRARPKEASMRFKGFRRGTEIPWVICAGTFYHITKQKPSFFFLRHADRTVAIELAEPAKFSLVVVEVGRQETPDDVAASIQAAVDQLGSRAGGGPTRSTSTAGNKETAKAAKGDPELLEPLLES